MSQPMTKSEQRVLSGVTKVLGPVHSFLYRISGGRIGARFSNGAPIVLLTTKGRKTGEPRTTPLIYLQDGERIVVVASKGGFPTNPAWYLNLQANPEVEVQLGRNVTKMFARTANPEEKAAYWPRLCEIYPTYQDYQARTERPIPVVILEPSAASA
jgi:deazaflavin-dependent oxidoreductase (nitroreductase family)